MPILAILITGAPALAQGPVTRSSSAISDAFAKSAIIALEGIRSDPSAAEFKDGELLVPRAIADKIDAANGDARTSAEVSLVNELHRLQQKHLLQNSEIERWRDLHPDKPALWAPLEVARKKADLCFSAFEAT
jgi:hypothetical protein